MQNSFRQFVSSSVLVLAVTVLGCGGGSSDSPELGEVSGVVTLDGQPVSNATVRFQPESGRSSEGITDDKGQYTLRYNASENGAKVGKHNVYVTTATEGHVESASGDDEGEWVEGQEETIPAKYQKEGTLTETVEAGANTIDLTLTSD